MKYSPVPDDSRMVHYIYVRFVKAELWWHELKCFWNTPCPWQKVVVFVLTRPTGLRVWQGLHLKKWHRIRISSNLSILTIFNDLIPLHLEYSSWLQWLQSSQSWQFSMDFAHGFCNGFFQWTFSIDFFNQLF